MSGIVEVSSNVPNDTTAAEWPGIVSRFQLVILASHRTKQLLRGAEPRIVADRLKRRNTSIALEELKRGLIPFKPIAMIPVVRELIDSPAYNGILESTT